MANYILKNKQCQPCLASCSVSTILLYESGSEVTQKHQVQVVNLQRFIHI